MMHHISREQAGSRRAAGSVLCLARQDRSIARLGRSACVLILRYAPDQSLGCSHPCLPLCPLAMRYRHADVPERGAAHAVILTAGCRPIGRVGARSS